MRYAARIALGALAAACVACTGPQIKIAPQPPAEYRTTTIGHGSACGFNLFGVIPIAVNGRAQRAYDEALQTTGGMGLLDVKVTERWYYAVVGNIYCTDIEGLGYTGGNASVGRPARNG